MIRIDLPALFKRLNPACRHALEKASNNADYIDTWRRSLGQLDVVDFDDISQAVEVLGSVTSPVAPLRYLIKEIPMTTRLSVSLIGLMAMALSACGDDETHTIAPVDAQALEALLQKSLDNMVFVGGGSFEMGDFGPIDPRTGGLYYSPYLDNKHLHTVTLDSYSIAAYQVSYADYDIYTAATGQQRVNTEGFGGRRRAPDVPVGVDWYHARDYCQWLGEQTGLPISLPTEAQWEYAARSRGGFHPFATADGFLRPGENYPTDEEIKQSTPADSTLAPFTIGLYPPNPLGIYHMGLNGFEWVNDWYSEDYYKVSPQHNPRGPESGELKTSRGASFGESGRTLLTVRRRSATPDLSIDDPSGLRTHSSFISNTIRCAVNLEDPPREAG